MAQTTTQKAVKGMSSQTIVTITLGFIEIISFSIMSRLLSEKDFGYFAAITAITTIFTTFSDTGIGAAVIQRKELTQNFVNNAFTINFLVALTLSFILVILAKPLSVGIVDSSMTIPLMFMAIPLFCHCLTSINFSIMKKRLEFLQVGKINVISLIISSIIAIVLAYYGFGYYAIMSRVIISSVLMLILSYFGSKTTYKFALDKETFKTIFKFSGWLTASVFFRNLSHQLDRLMMSRLISVTALGAYNRPKEFINQINNKIGGIFDITLFPILSQIQNDKTKLKNGYLKSMYLLNIGSVILSMGLIINGKFIIRVFFGEKWLGILPVFQILSLYMAFSYDGRLADCFLRSLGLTKQQFFFRILQFIIYTLGLFIGYRKGIIGVAISVLACNIIMIIIKHNYLSKIIHVTFSEGVSVLLKSWKLALINTPIFLFLLYSIPDSIIGNILIVIIYIILIVIEFLYLPSFVGKTYKDFYYSDFKRFFYHKILKKIK